MPARRASSFASNAPERQAKRERDMRRLSFRGSARELQSDVHMNTTKLYRPAVGAITGAFAAWFAFPSLAKAEEVIIVREREAAVYPVEIEPHFSFGAEDVYGVAGFGGGLRVSIPFVAAHMGRVSDNLGITFGGDIIHYDNCYYVGTDCGANYLMAPVAAQWNIIFSRRFSLLVEGGAYLYKGWYDTCGPGCSGPSDFGVLPTVAVGGRLRVGWHTALLLRVGYPMITLGVSFL